MPYQQYGWGDALAAWGNTLSRWGQRKEEEAVSRLKNRYGTNVEAWRQDAIKDPKSEEAKYYKKFVGDPSQPLPEDPQMEQQRAMRQQQEAWLGTLNPEQQKIARGLLFNVPAGILEPLLRQMGQGQQGAVSPEERLKTIGVVMDRWPTAKPKAVTQMTDYGITGQTPAKINLETTPGNTAGIMGGLQRGGTAGMIGEMQKQYIPSSESELLGEMGQTKQQIKMEDLAAKRKMAEDKFSELKEYRNKVDDRFNRSFKAQQARWNEAQKYKMTPEQRLEFNNRMKSLNQQYALLNKDRDMASKELARAEADVSRLKQQKGFLGDMGGEYAGAIDASINEANAKIDSARAKLTEINSRLDAMESDLPDKTIKEPPDAGAPTSGTSKHLGL